MQHFYVSIMYSLLRSTSSPSAVFTYDDADFTALIVKSTRHHGAGRVINHRHDVRLIVLENNIIFNSKPHLNIKVIAKLVLGSHFKKYHCLKKLIYYKK